MQDPNEAQLAAIFHAHEAASRKAEEAVQNVVEQARLVNEQILAITREVFMHGMRVVPKMKIQREYKCHLTE